MEKISDIIKRKRPVFSFEIYPPKTEKGEQNLYAAIEELCELKPDYVSVTYGAGGSTSKTTFRLVKDFREKFGLNCVHHLTLVGSTVEELREKITAAAEVGCHNMLALRGDAPQDSDGVFRPVEGGLNYSYELVDLIKEVAPQMCVAVAGYPESHADSPSREEDVEYLKNKITHGAEAVVTQLFFEPALYADYLERLKNVGVDIPVIPGILPITNYESVVNFCARCGATVPQSVHDAFKPIADDAGATSKRGIEWAVEQGLELLKLGAPGLHFYCLNKTEPIRTVWKELQARL